MRSFYTRIRSCFRRREQIIPHSKNLPSGLPSFVQNDESLARFLTSSGQFSRNNQNVKAAAFLPNSTNETSVFRHEGEPRDELWQIGDENIKTRSFYGTAIVKVQHIRASSLEVIAEEPPLRHANIKGWSVESDPTMKKAKNKELALEIARKANLVLR